MAPNEANAARPEPRASGVDWGRIGGAAARESWYRVFRGSGASRRASRRIALVEAVREDELKQLNHLGVRYDRDQVRQAIVHGRSDIVLAIAMLGEVSDSLRSVRRWLTAVAVLLAALLWSSLL